MVGVLYKTVEGGELKRLDLSSPDLPAGNIAEIHVDVHYVDRSPKFAQVSAMLNQRAGKLDNIRISHVDQVTTEFLSFFVLVSKKARKLSLCNIVFNEGVCTTLMAVITDPNGLTALRLEDMENDEGSFAEDQLGLLFEAISTSTSLEHLYMMAHSECSMEACRIIARGLRRNQSLKRFEFFPYRYPNSVFQQSIVHAGFFGLESLEMADPWGGEHPVTLSTLVEGLSRESCKLQSLDLSFEIAVDMDLANLMAVENSSLLHLRLRYANLTCLQFVNFAKLFDSLQVLDMSQSLISELRPLGALLLSEACVLERLDLCIDEVDDDEWLGFCLMIPRVKSLKSLGLNNRCFASLSGLQRRQLLDALGQNTSLDSFRVFDEVFSAPDDWRRDDCWFRSKLSVPLSFNRAGRRELRNRPIDQSLKHGLLPLVLERATKLKYYSVQDDWKSPSLLDRRQDAVYWLLRDSYLFEP